MRYILFLELQLILKDPVKYYRASASKKTSNKPDTCDNA